MTGAWDPAWSIGALWLVAGAAVATGLAWRGHPEATAWTALVAWPFLLPLLRALPEREPAGRADTIEDAIAGAREAIARVDGVDPRWLGEIEALRAALRGMDRRLAPIEAALAVPVPGDDPELARAHAALAEEAERARAAIRHGIAGLHHLRLQAGLADLAGGSAGTAARLDELRRRMAALAEVARVGDGA